MMQAMNENIRDMKMKLILVYKTFLYSRIDQIKNSFLAISFSGHVSRTFVVSLFHL